MVFSFYFDKYAPYRKMFQMKAVNLPEIYVLCTNKSIFAKISFM
jgi:hypothetical protein